MGTLITIKDNRRHLKQGTTNNVSNTNIPDTCKNPVNRIFKMQTPNYAYAEKWAAVVISKRYIQMESQNEVLLATIPSDSYYV